MFHDAKRTSLVVKRTSLDVKYTSHAVKYKIDRGGGTFPSRTGNFFLPILQKIKRWGMDKWM